MLGEFAHPLAAAGRNRQQTQIELPEPLSQGDRLGRPDLDLKLHRMAGEAVGDPFLEPFCAGDGGRTYHRQ